MSWRCPTMHSQARVAASIPGKSRRRFMSNMSKKSAGLLLFRETAAGLEVLLVHPGGPFWAKKDDGSWSIPKGEFADDEEPLAAAKREFEEEMGFPPAGDFMPLDSLKQPSGKLVFAW